MDDLEAGGLAPGPVFRWSGQSRAKEGVAHSLDLGGVGRQALRPLPGTEGQPSAGTQQAGRFFEEARLVLQVFQALDHPDDVERFSGHGQGGGVGAQNLRSLGQASSGVEATSGASLTSADRQAEDLATESSGEPASRGAVAAADVEHAVAGPETCSLGQVGDEALLGGLRRAVAVRPETVVDVLAPEEAVEDG